MEWRCRAADVHAGAASWRALSLHAEEWRSAVCTGLRSLFGGTDCPASRFARGISMKTFLKYAAALLVGAFLGWTAHWYETRPQLVIVKATPAKPLNGGGLQLA